MLYKAASSFKVLIAKLNIIYKVSAYIRYTVRRTELIKSINHYSNGRGGEGRGKNYHKTLKAKLLKECN